MPENEERDDAEIEQPPDQDTAYLGERRPADQFEPAGVAVKRLDLEVRCPHCDRKVRQVGGRPCTVGEPWSPGELLRLSEAGPQVCPCCERDFCVNLPVWLSQAWSDLE